MQSYQQFILPIDHLYPRLVDRLTSMSDSRYMPNDLFAKVIARYPEDDNESFDDPRDESKYHISYLEVYEYFHQYIVRSGLVGYLFEYIASNELSVIFAIRGDPN